MAEKLIKNSVIPLQETSEENLQEISLQERVAALELELKIFKQAERVGDIGNWQINLNTFETVYSDNLFRLYGLEPYDRPAHADTFISFIHPDDREVAAEAFEKSYIEIIPIHLEYRIIRQDGEVRYVSVVSSVTKNFAGEPLLTGITQDITERKSLEIKLRDSAEKIHLQNELSRQAEQIGHFGTWQINLSTRQNHYSENFLRIFGLKPGNGQPGFESFSQFVSLDDKNSFDELLKRIFEAKQPPDTEFRIMRPDGKIRHIRLKGRIFKNEEGDDLVAGVMQDITSSVQKDKQLKEAYEKLSLQNETFRQAEKTIGIGSWSWNLTTNKIVYSDHVYTILGLKPHSIPPGYENFEQFVYPDDRPWLKGMSEKIRKELKEQEYIYRIIRSDGELRYLKGRNQPVFPSDGHVIIIGTTQDITEDILLHQQLNERIHFAEMLSDNILDEIIVTDASNNIIAWNSSSENSYQLKKEQVLGKNIFELFPQMKTRQLLDIYNKALAGETIHMPEFKSIHGNGYCELTLVPVKNEKDKVTAVLSIQHNITEQFILKRELQERLEFIEKLIESSIHRISVVDREMNFLYWNKTNETHFELKKHKVVGKNIFEVFPSFRSDRSYHDIKKALKGETIHIPVNRDGEAGSYTDAYMIPIKGSREEVVAVLWIVNDLTEIITAEKKIKESDNFLRKTADASPDSIGIYDLLTNHPLYINDNLARWLGVTSEALVEMGYEGRLQLIHPDDRQNLRDFNERMSQAEDGEVRTLEYRVQVKEDDFMWVRNRAKVFKRDSEGKVTHILSILQDITEQKNFQTALEESRHFIQKVTNSTTDVLYVLDLNERNFVFIDDRTTELFGLDFSTVIAKEHNVFLEVLHPDDYQKRMDHIAACIHLKDEEIKEVEIRLRVRDGNYHWFKVRDIAFKRDKTGQVTQTIGLVTDINEKKTGKRKDQANR